MIFLALPYIISALLLRLELSRVCAWLYSSIYCLHFLYYGCHDCRWKLNITQNLSTYHQPQQFCANIGTSVWAIRNSSSDLLKRYFVEEYDNDLKIVFRMQTKRPETVVNKTAPKTLILIWEVRGDCLVTDTWVCLPFLLNNVLHNNNNYYYFYKKRGIADDDMHTYMSWIAVIDKKIYL